MQCLTQHTYREHPFGGVVSLGVSVVDSGRETPGPIPNPEAKPARADGTALGRVWESKLPPTLNMNNSIGRARPLSCPELVSGCGRGLSPSPKETLIVRSCALNILSTSTYETGARVEALADAIELLAALDGGAIDHSPALKPSSPPVLRSAVPGEAVSSHRPKVVLAR